VPILLFYAEFYYSIGLFIQSIKGVSQDLTAAACRFRQTAAPGDLIAQLALPDN
jgi:TPR repeat protein